MRTRAGQSLGRPFGRLLGSSTASNLADGVLLAALPLLARSITAAPVPIATVTVASTLPWLLFSLPAGAHVDRSSRPLTMAGANAIRAMTAAALVVLVARGPAAVPVLVTAVFVLGIAETLCDTAAQAWLPQLVPSERLEAANGRLFGAQIAANTLVGPAVGAWLFGVAAAVPFALVAAAFGVAALLLPRGSADVVPAHRPGGASLPREIREGLAWVWRDRGVRAFAVGAAGVNLAHTAGMAVVVLLLRDELRVSPFGYGLVLSAAAVGGIAGAQVASRMVSAVGRRPAALGAVLVFAVSLVGAGLAPTARLVAVALGAFGVAGEVWNVVAVSYRQARVPPQLLGRVMATYRFVAYGAMPAGAALGGATTAVAGVRGTFVAAGAAVLLLAGYLTVATSRLEWGKDGESSHAASAAG